MLIRPGAPTLERIERASDGGELMAEHPNVATVREGLEASLSGDYERVAELMADDIEWHEIGSSEAIRGREAVIAHMSADSPGESSIEIHDIVGNDEHVVALTNVIARLQGRTLEYRVARVFHVRDGKVTARWALSDDTQRIAEFYA
jgi:uncharacterized protein